MPLLQAPQRFLILYLQRIFYTIVISVCVAITAAQTDLEAPFPGGDIRIGNLRFISSVIIHISRSDLRRSVPRPYQFKLGIKAILHSEGVLRISHNHIEGPVRQSAILSLTRTRLVQRRRSNTYNGGRIPLQLLILDLHFVLMPLEIRIHRRTLIYGIIYLCLILQGKGLLASGRICDSLFKDKRKGTGIHIALGKCILQTKAVAFLDPETTRNQFLIDLSIVIIPRHRIRDRHLFSKSVRRNSHNGFPGDGLCLQIDLCIVLSDIQLLRPDRDCRFTGVALIIIDLIPNLFIYRHIRGIHRDSVGDLIAVRHCILQIQCPFLIRES